MSAAPPIALPHGVARHLIGGRELLSGTERLPVHNPATGEVIAEVGLGGPAEVDAAVAAARAAFPAWSATPLKERVQVFFRYRQLLEAHRQELAALITEEHGKILSEGDAEVAKAMELCEFACSLPQVALGEVLEVSRGIECRLERFPLGVVASIAPFNFPVMVPHWTIPNALALGNCMVFKPSERVPLSTLRFAALLREAGLPDGVFNVVQGGREAVEAICDHPGIAAVSFVGSTSTAQVVYRRATGVLKRALALGGAKNHLFVLPDAEPELTADTVLNSAIGCAGQRCMAASVMVALTGTDHIVHRLTDLARRMVPGRDYGPVISAAAKARIEAYITEAVADGARLLLDGRGLTVPGSEGGFWVGPTILDQVRPDMRIAQEEVFGPVLAILRAGSLDEGLSIQQSSRYGNAAAIFTTSGGAAHDLMERASAGMVGVNVGVPVPREPFPFGGWNDSKYGVGDITGKSSIEFWTQAKKTTVRW
ncbi:MAG: CoA-acylating methylmalonate-semialdehyde dehydrogenase [Gemmatimonadota bacterium]|jgi:malonate-semialdehyde dehydrogenase (acetylating)/methylmalonate-semialdehyde dehydrogenase|nr:CoA-acylating methylmalonate-semialdehyde dehydrogenase [Gemmatimonadota bacterium]